MTRVNTEKFGGYNDPPPNLKEMSELEWAQSTYFSRDPIHKEFRQFVITGTNGRDTFHNFNLFYMDEHSGYAITSEYYEGKVRAFKFGCEHKYKELSQSECKEKEIRHFGSCYHVTECEKCGHIMCYDSSG